MFIMLTGLYWLSSPLLIESLEKRRMVKAKRNREARATQMTVSTKDKFCLPPNVF